MTPVQICNLALAKIGENPDITSVTGTDTSVHGLYASLFYPQAMAVMLDAHVWSFATITVALTQATNSNPFWQYAYTPPSDFFGVTMLLDPDFLAAQQLPNGANFSLENGLIYSNTNNSVLVYTSNLAANAPYPTTGFNPLFIEALCTWLAAHFAGALIKGAEGAAAFQSYSRIFQAALASAMESDAQYRKVRPVYVPQAARARWGVGLVPGLQAGESWQALGPVGGNNVV